MWAIVTARGGSKSIPLKNMVLVQNTHLLDFGVRAALASDCFERIICSTDHSLIEKRAHKLGIEVDWRPKAFCGDDISTRAVIEEFLLRQNRATLPKLIAIIQPTSIFLRAEDIQRLYTQMQVDNIAKSGQTLARPPHNHHAWNQRVLKANRVSFNFSERKVAYNKQLKPELFIFGNLVICRTQALLAGEDVFEEPSAAIEIEWPYDLDLDGPNDLKMAEALLACDMVKLPHMTNLNEQHNEGV